MNNPLTVLAGTFLSATLLSTTALVPAATAQPACVTQNMTVPPGANATDRTAPFFIDTAGLDFKTTPPTRDPSNPNYPRATELPDGTLPSAEDEYMLHQRLLPTITLDEVNRLAKDWFPDRNRIVIVTAPEKPGRFRIARRQCRDGFQSPNGRVR